MKRELILGAKYFFKDKILNDIVEAQIMEINDVELTYKNLEDNEEYYRELEEIEIVSIISEEYAKKLNDKEIFSIQTDLIKGIIGRSEMNKYSEDNFKKLKINEDTVLISVTDPKSEKLSKSIQNNFKDVLNIQFWDVEKDTEIGSYTSIDEETASIIRDFILKHKKDNFLINCEAGMSRSAAIGFAVLLICKYDCDKYLMATSPNPITSHHRYKPNFTVYDMISKKWD